jgi:hypothetical protein
MLCAHIIYIHIHDGSIMDNLDHMETLEHAVLAVVSAHSPLASQPLAERLTRQAIGDSYVESIEALFTPCGGGGGGGSAERAL